MGEQEKTASEAATAARELFQDKENSRFWPGPLARHLEHTGPKRALIWAIRLFQEPSLTQRKTMLHQRWLTELELLIDSGTADQCNKTAFEIWNHDPVMNLLERGIARLYWALQNHVSGLLEPDYFLQIGAAVAMLLDSGKSTTNTESSVFERCISLFHQLLEA